MTKKQMKQVIFMGVGCVILLIAGIIYSLLFNDARWVKNMDMSNYVFSIKDIPMLIVGALIAIYVLYVTVIFFKNAFSKNFKDKNYSRTVSSYWGLCGIEYSNAIVHDFQKFRAPFSGKIVHIFPEQSAVI